jgi:hypothetical protein
MTSPHDEGRGRRPMKKSRSKHVTTERLAHVWDVLHFVRMGELRDVSFLWYRMKFKPDRTESAAARQWERFKQLIRALEIPHELVPVEGDEDEEVGALALRFAMPSSIEKVEKMLDRRTVPEEDESAWVRRTAV